MIVHYNKSKRCYKRNLNVNLSFIVITIYFSCTYSQVLFKYNLYYILTMAIDDDLKIYMQ